MPPGIDMQAIHEAIARRMTGGGVPAVDQISTPGGSLPTGGAPTPVPNSPPVAPTPTGMSANIPSSQGNSLLKSAQTAQGPSFDDETRNLSKALVKKLLDVM